MMEGKKQIRGRWKGKIRQKRKLLKETQPRALGTREEEGEKYSYCHGL